MPPATWCIGSPEGLRVLGELLGVVGEAVAARPLQIGLVVVVALRSIDDLPVVENDHVGSGSTQVTDDEIDVRMSVGKVSMEDAQRPLIQLPSPTRLPQLPPGAPQVVEGDGGLHGLGSVGE